MSAVKHAFEKIGHGIEHVVDSVGKDIKGLGRMAGGVLTGNPSEIKNGLKDIGNGLKEGIGGLGEVAGGAAGAAVGMTPLGAAINGMSGGKLSKLVEGVGDACAGVLKDGIDGIGEVGKGIAHGNFKEIFDGAMKVGNVAMLAVPGAGEAAAARDIAMAAGKDLLKQGVENEVFNG